MTFYCRLLFCSSFVRFGDIKTHIAAKWRSMLLFPWTSFSLQWVYWTSSLVYPLTQLLCHALSDMGVEVRAWICFLFLLAPLFNLIYMHFSIKKAQYCDNLPQDTHVSILYNLHKYQFRLTVLKFITVKILSLCFLTWRPEMLNQLHSKYYTVPHMNVS